MITQLGSKRTVHFCNCWFLEANAEIQEEQSDFLTSPIQRDYLGLFQSTQYQAIRLKRRVQIFFTTHIFTFQIKYIIGSQIIIRPLYPFTSLSSIVIIKCHLRPDPLSLNLLWHSWQLLTHCSTQIMILMKVTSQTELEWTWTACAIFF